MKVLFVTSEAHPFAVSGGLGDVSGALPAALRRRFVGCRVVLPLYADVPGELRESMTFLGSFCVPVAWRRQYCGLFEAKTGGVTYYLLDNEYYFKRPGLYGYYDDAERFAFFSRAVLEMLPLLDYRPDVLHCNDWQTALTPVYYRLYYADRPEYAGMKTLLTVHNIQYQGKYGEELLEDVLGISRADAGLVEYDGCVNLLKGGMEAADAISTVSPTYADELTDEWFAYGLHGFLRERRGKMRGIINGIDTALYNPETDEALPCRYNAETAAAGKAENKRALQREMGLPERPDVPLFGMVTRLVAQKGLDLVLAGLEELLQSDLQVAVLGAGDWRYESALDELAARYPERLALRRGFIPPLARQIYAGADFFLMPSKSEPCGLAQMVALRYGTLPVVRATGGLRDTVTDCGDGEGNGFTFLTFDTGDMLNALYRAMALYADRPAMEQTVRRAMACDNSWGASARAYARLYKDLTGK